MDIATILGMILAWGALIGSLVMEGGDVRSLVNLPAALLVFGGTAGACLTSFKYDQIVMVPELLKKAFRDKPVDLADLVSKMVRNAEKARKEGFLSLESEVRKNSDEFTRRALRLAIDGTDPDTLREILSTDIYFQQQRHKIGEQIFNTLAGYSPTLGIIGTVMGLVHMLSNLSDPAKMGPLIAAAFIATLYGVSTANLLFLPIAHKLKLLAAEERLQQELIIEAMIGLQSGDNPMMIEEKLKAFLSLEARKAVRGASVVQIGKAA